MAQYHVTLVAKPPGGTRMEEHVYVTAPDTKDGYRKAARKAEARLAKRGKAGFRASDARCVG